MCAANRQGLAHALLNQVSTIEALAWAAANVARLSDWVPVMEPGFELVPFNRCCSYNKALPPGFVQAVAATQVGGAAGAGGDGAAAMMQGAQFEVGRTGGSGLHNLNKAK